MYRFAQLVLMDLSAPAANQATFPTLPLVSFFLMQLYRPVHRAVPYLDAVSAQTLSLCVQAVNQTFTSTTQQVFYPLSKLIISA
jgi:hypothetical protein